MNIQMKKSWKDTVRRLFKATDIARLAIQLWL